MIHLRDFLLAEAPLFAESLDQPKLCGVDLSAFALMIAQDQLHRPGRKLILLPKELLAEKLFLELDGILEDGVHYQPSPGLEPFEGAIPTAKFWEQRLEWFKQLSNPQGIWISSFEQASEYFPSPDEFLSRSLHLRPDLEFEPERLLSSLLELGYKDVSMVEKPGEFSRRGGIVDVYPLLSENAYRLEYFDTEIESIRTMDLFSQRSKEHVRELIIDPCSEIPHTWEPKHYEPQSAWNWWRRSAWQSSKSNLGDYDFDRIWLYSEGASQNFWSEINQKRHDAWQHHQSYVENLDPLADLYLSPEQMQQWTAKSCEVHSSPTEMNWNAGVSAQQRSSAGLDQLRSWAEEWQKEGVELWLLAPSQSAAERLQRSVADLPYSGIAIGSLSQGMIWPRYGIALLTDHQLFHRMRTRTKRRKFGGGGIAIPSFDALEMGDYVIHADYGLGRFMGIKREKTVHGSVDCIALEYASKARLTIPVSDLPKLERYPVSEEHEPGLHSIGGKKWDAQKEKARKKAALVAQELVKLYADRASQAGHAFAKDGADQEQFGLAFPWELTPDQHQANLDVARDMHAHRPMDRLVCGDVGFGKTEVAMRAAFRAVMDSKQVALMVPTTLLASQHHENFLERFEGWPIRIELLSRFRSAKEKKEVLEGLKQGTVDIVVGTQALISKSLKFKDLGLLMIDEEQKFGVKQKESIRSMRSLVDTLTLTATPIPRTLHMSLVGARDISVIRTPPRQRLPVETRVMPWDDEILGDALRAEISRGGQCFVVQDRIEGLMDLAEKILHLVPEARIALLHGQMAEEELERTMSGFVHAEFDVLISTNIVESGIDIPRANTMIVYHAQRFGLSQLYQLRGRVGRSDLSAHCYLVYPKGQTLRRESEERLRALEAHTELGAGFQLAMRDLEIRGAGNLLGMEQSGFFLEVGYETYIRLVQEELRKLRGESRPLDIDPRLQLDVHAFLPEFYVEDGVQRLALYQKISRAESPFELDDISMEMKDRFGDYPAQVLELVEMMKLRLSLRRLGIAELDHARGRVIMVFSEHFPPSRERMESLVGKAPLEIQLNMSSPIEIKLISGRLSASELLTTLNPWLQAVP